LFSNVNCLEDAPPAEGGFMANGSSEKDPPQMIDAASRRDEVLGLVRLLTLAKASADACCADILCVALLDRCIEGLLTRHGMSFPNLGQSTPKAEFMPFPTLLRALAYARAETLDPLNDTDSAELLTKCITLMSAFQPDRRGPHQLPSSPTYN
jgi:hypothetical protein